jgi:hypothetical protein
LGQHSVGSRRGLPLWLPLAMATLATYLLCVLPVVVAQNPPLHDYPFHLARMYILAHSDESNAARSYYEIHTFVLPNIVMDVVVPWLSRLVPVDVACRMFLAATLLLQLSGCGALYYALHRRYTLWPLVAGLILYNWIFLFGFLNYLFGIGALLWATAIWTRLSERAAAVRMLLGTLLSTTLFFCHIIAYGLFAVIVAGYELRRVVEAPRNIGLATICSLAASASIFVVPAALFFLSPTAGVDGTTTHSLLNLIWTPALFIRVLLGANWVLDVMLLAAAVGFCVSLLAGGHLVLARSMYLALALLLVTYLLIPHQLAGDWGADSRIPIVLMLVLIASTHPLWRQRQRKIAVAAFFVLLIVRQGLISYDWHKYDGIYADFRQAFARLPAGSVLVSATEDGIPSLQSVDLHLWQPPLEHVAALAAEYNVFVPQIWAKPGQQPIVPRRRYERLYRFQANRPLPIASSQDLAQVAGEAHRLAAPHPSYLLLLYPDRLSLVYPNSAKVVAAGRDFVLFRLVEDVGGRAEPGHDAG